MSPLLSNAFFAAAIHAVLVSFSEDPDILRDLVHPEEDLGEDGVGVDSLACVRRSVWGMLYADDAGIVYRSSEGLAMMMTVIVTAFEAAEITVSKKKTETITVNKVLVFSPVLRFPTYLGSFFLAEGTKPAILRTKTVRALFQNFPANLPIVAKAHNPILGLGKICLRRKKHDIVYISDQDTENEYFAYVFLFQCY